MISNTIYIVMKSDCVERIYRDKQDAKLYVLGILQQSLYTIEVYTLAADNNIYDHVDTIYPEDIEDISGLGSSYASNTEDDLQFMADNAFSF